MADLVRRRGLKIVAVPTREVDLSVEEPRRHNQHEPEGGAPHRPAVESREERHAAVLGVGLHGKCTERHGHLNERPKARSDRDEQDDGETDAAHRFRAAECFEPMELVAEGGVEVPAHITTVRTLIRELDRAADRLDDAGACDESDVERKSSTTVGVGVARAAIESPCADASYSRAVTHTSARSHPASCVTAPCKVRHSSVTSTKEMRRWLAAHESKALCMAAFRSWHCTRGAKNRSSGNRG